VALDNARMHAFIYLRGKKKPAGKAPRNGSLQAHERAAEATSSLQVVQMVQIRACLQPENTGWWGYFINNKSASICIKRTRGT